MCGEPVWLEGDERADDLRCRKHDTDPIVCAPDCAGCAFMIRALRRLGAGSPFRVTRGLGGTWSWSVKDGAETRTGVSRSPCLAFSEMFRGEPRHQSKRDTKTPGAGAVD